MYAKIESERLIFIRLNQKKLRVEDYIHPRDAINSDGNINKLGKPTISSSFTGGPWYMHERTQDAMTYVRNFGRPDLFITFTCNPQWKEITDELMARQKSHDRHDLIELPNPESDPMLHGVIKTQMIHCPCGSINPLPPCMKEGKCTKRYPRIFLKDTQTGHDGYPLYRRRKPEDGGYVTTKKIVPENPGIKSSDALGRVYTVHPSNSECFHLRLLLHEVLGPTSFSDLKTVNGTVCETFKQACELRGLLEDDPHWKSTLDEAATTHSARMLRDLFAVMLQTCSMSNPTELWNLHKENMAEDILHETRIRINNIDLTYTNEIFNKTLIAFEDKIKALGGTNLKVFGLPEAQRDVNNSLNYEILRETSYDIQKLTSYIATNEPNLVEDQRFAFEKITSAIFTETGGIFFLDAPGGTGKTYLINLLLAKVRERNMIALAVASSSIVATLLTGGRTAHLVFKLPLNLLCVENPICNISRNSDKAKVLRMCKLIVWDECTMAHKYALEALDATMKDIFQNEKCMGGITLVLSGDFRQTLPVIPRSTKADELHASIKSYIWKDVQRFGLKTNMRVHLTGDASTQQFAQNPLHLGNGEMAIDNEGFISLENIGNIITMEELKDRVFPNIENTKKIKKWLCERAILSPTNDGVKIINNQLFKKLPGASQIYKSVDTTVETNQAVDYPTEFLNFLEPSGIPAHKLELKISAPIMLLRNLDPPALCNGTRLIMKKLMPNVIEAVILTGHSAGKDVFILRIPHIPSDVPFEFKRFQFPVRLSFAMSFNKSQGQSLKVVGLDLPWSCFSHGQL
ncbi:hypothetical protein AVEN_95400-1 [Araneus ventricosus]|uniref:ATP-dependent DNA helicase n=1 Tax=Araneus ventricosus TaxID=182803 RepID=A0A4Y2CHT6_ARAVE|nr:hypothetical protein AVEN_95400-1 [Araneus ventricosus]